MLVFGLMAAGVVAFLVWPGEREPEYKGKKLSEWLRLHQATRGTPADREAISALEHIGTNAIPMMLEWLRYEPSAGTKAVYAFADRLPHRLASNRIVRRLSGLDKFERARMAEATLCHLGPEATRSVIPELVRMMANPSILVSLRAICALPTFGKEVLGPMLTAVSNTNHPQRCVIADMIPCIRGLGTNGDLAVPVLLECIRDRDSALAESALESLGKLGRKPQIVVPVLIDFLMNTNMAIRYKAIEALAGFGTNAQPAVPALFKLLEDKNGLMQFVANRTLMQVSPDQWKSYIHTRNASAKSSTDMPPRTNFPTAN
jgi:hypothetical protein